MKAKWDRIQAAHAFLTDHDHREGTFTGKLKVDHIALDHDDQSRVEYLKKRREAKAALQNRNKRHDKHVLAIAGSRPTRVVAPVLTVISVQPAKGTVIHADWSHGAFRPAEETYVVRLVQSSSPALEPVPTVEKEGLFLRTGYTSHLLPEGSYLVSVGGEGPFGRGEWRVESEI